MKGSRNSSSTPNDGERDDNNDKDTLPVFYYEKMVGYMPSSFANLVFAGERVEVGLRRGKFDYAATASSSNRRPGMSGGN